VKPTDTSFAIVEFPVQLVGIANVPPIPGKHPGMPNGVSCCVQPWFGMQTVECSFPPAEELGVSSGLIEYVPLELIEGDFHRLPTISSIDS
jgi:hypothetical protein